MTGGGPAGRQSSKWSTERNLTGVEMSKAMCKVTDKLMCKAMYKAFWARLRALACGARGVRAVRRDAGMVTSEYAMGIVAAVAFAVVLYKVVTSGQVSAELQGIVKRALDAGV